MTATTETIERPPGAPTASVAAHPWIRFAAPFAAAVLATLTMGVAGIVAYDAWLDGRIVPGVRVGGVDLSGLGRDAATTRVGDAFSSFGDGRIVLDAGVARPAIAFSDFARRPAVDALVDEAMTVGRSGNALERAVSLVRVRLGGVDLAPRLTLDEAALAMAVETGLSRLERPPVDAAITMRASGIVTSPAVSGRRFDIPEAVTSALHAVSRVDAPAEVVVVAKPIPVPPGRSDAVVAVARARAERMLAADLAISLDDDAWTIPSTTVRAWIRFEERAAGAVYPVVDAALVEAALDPIAEDVHREPVSATFLVSKDGTKVGSTRSVDGRSLDTASMIDAIDRELRLRADGGPPSTVPAVVSVIEPELTSEEAQAVAPQMVRLGWWKTWFPIGERNAWGANIWLPARFIDGTVLAPGERFEWFSAVGPITRARGFGMGGVIHGDHTDPMGALGGGMCSSSTTLFNAALRAGLAMGERANHTYYISRYPLGLDATVWIDGTRRRTVTFTNDMDDPVLIRGIRYKDGDGRGWVRYEIWGVPDGRTVSISDPVVSNLRKATTQVREVTTLPVGVRRQTEWPSNGMDVVVTRVVRNADGRVLSRDVYRSHYALWNGRIEVGVAPA